ncbi:MAG: hypothetical protein ICV69_02725 [Thermoleophilaceae bacterium]|nr:hypothetical protein [Thermoleophilaceae bacterium]
MLTGERGASTGIFRPVRFIEQTEEHLEVGTTLPIGGAVLAGRSPAVQPEPAEVGAAS